MSTEASGLSDTQLAERATPRPWYYDGRDIFSTAVGQDGHRLVVPLPETWHPYQEVSPFDAELIVRAVNTFGDAALLRERIDKLELALTPFASYADVLRRWQGGPPLPAHAFREEIMEAERLLLERE